MKNASAILQNVIKSLPEDMQGIARDVLTVRFLGQNSANETAEILGIEYQTVVNVLKTIRKITKGKNPCDFATA